MQSYSENLDSYLNPDWKRTHTHNLKGYNSILSSFTDPNSNSHELEHGAQIVCHCFYYTFMMRFGNFC